MSKSSFVKPAISALCSKYGNPVGLEYDIRALTHRILDVIGETMAESVLKVQSASVPKHAVGKGTSPSLTLIVHIINDHPVDLRPHLHKAIEAATQAINDCIISASLDAAQQLPDDPAAQDFPDAIKSLVAQQLEQLIPHVNGEPGTLERDLFIVAALLFRELSQSTPEKVLKALKKQ